MDSYSKQKDEIIKNLMVDKRRKQLHKSINQHINYVKTNLPVTLKTGTWRGLKYIIRSVVEDDNTQLEFFEGVFYCGNAVVCHIECFKFPTRDIDKIIEIAKTEPECIDGVMACIDNDNSNLMTILNNVSNYPHGINNGEMFYVRKIETSVDFRKLGLTRILLMRIITTAFPKDDSKYIYLFTNTANKVKIPDYECDEYFYKMGFKKITNTVYAIFIGNDWSIVNGNDFRPWDEDDGYDGTSLNK